MIKEVTTNYDILNILSPEQVAEGFEYIVKEILKVRVPAFNYTEDMEKQDKLDILNWLNSACDIELVDEDGEHSE